MTQKKATAITFNVLMGHVGTLENAVWSCGTDEYKDGVSDTAVNKRAELASSARAKVREVVETLVNERDALLSEVAELRQALKSIANSACKRGNQASCLDRYQNAVKEHFTETFQKELLSTMCPACVAARALLGKER